MSYCVNCGVELENGCKACPLCDTQVINPAQGQVTPESLAYPQDIKIPKSTRKRFLVFVVSMAMLIPNAVLIVWDIAFWSSGISAFIFGGTVLAWLWFLFPLLWKKPMPMVLLQIDAISLFIYLNLFRLKGNTTGWFGSLAIPIIVALWVVAAVFIIWLKKPRRKVAKAIAATVAINVICYVVEFCINMFISGKLQMGISAAITACSIPLIIFFVVLAKSRRLNSWVSRKFFM